MRRRLIIAATGLAGLCFGTRAQAANDGAALLARFASTLTAHDINAFATLFAEDYVNHQTSAAAPPPPAGLSQKQASVAFFAARLKGIPDLRVEIEASVVSRNKAAASFIYTGTHDGPLFGVPPTGRKLRFTSCDIFAIKSGLFVEHWGMGDIAGVMAQLRG
jgi:predicted ester cyclase